MLIKEWNSYNRTHFLNIGTFISNRNIFAKMPNLKRIYIQDPNAEQIKSSLDSLYSTNHTKVTHINNNVFTITNPTQFYLPPEL